jgi:hypothetical protein
MKNIKIKKNLLAKLKELNIIKKKLETEIAELKIKIIMF